MENNAPNSSERKPARAKRWFCFSISTLLLVSVIVALSVSHWTSARDRFALEQQLAQIRRDHDLLEISDPNKIHVLPIESINPYMGQFRVHLPEGEDYLLVFEWISAPGEKQSHAEYPVKPLVAGTYLIDYVIRYEPKQDSGRWNVSISARSQDRSDAANFAFPRETPRWFDADFVSDADVSMLPIDSHATESGRITIGNESILEDRCVHLFDVDDEVTLVQYRVNSEVLFGTLIKNVFSSDEGFRVRVIKAPE
ncbi:hypothetical protein [Bremerella sp.]|uniref:hypothetical protein n=1 Tax=Bremerella sp. TaxID=2795602 RepID=UPI0039197995